MLQNKMFRIEQNTTLLPSPSKKKNNQTICETSVCQYETQVSQVNDVLELGIDVLAHEVGVAETDELEGSTSPESEELNILGKLQSSCSLCSRWLNVWSPCTQFNMIQVPFPEEIVSNPH